MKINVVIQSHQLLKMMVRGINIIVFFALIGLIYADQWSRTFRFTFTCILLVIFTSGIILDFLFIKKRDEIKIVLLIFIAVLGLFVGSLSSMLIGSQQHDMQDGGPSFGIPFYPIALGTVYTICFSTFVFCLSYLRSNTFQSVALFTWVIGTIVYGYFFGDSYTSFIEDVRNAGENYDSDHFPSETKIVTPLLTITVSFWAILLLIKSVSVQKKKSPPESKEQPAPVIT